MVVVNRIMLSTAAIKEKSEELQIPFANMALAFVTEEFLIRISESEFAAYLWIKNAGNFRMDYYKWKMADSPKFYYQKNPAIKEDAGNVPGQVMSVDLAEIMMHTLCRSGMKENIQWEYSISEDTGLYTIDVTVLIENIRVPFRIKIEVAENETLFQNECELKLSTQNNYQLKLNSYPEELEVTDCIFQIMEKLELINDMSNYQTLYFILKEQTLDGRKVQLQLLDKFKKRGLEVRRQRLSILLEYKQYTYMKKKWKAHLKSENKKSPEWEDVMELLERFLSPVWERMCADTIFIGDWMPELSRFFE